MHIIAKAIAFDNKISEACFGLKPALRVENERIVFRTPVITNKVKFATAVLLAVAYDCTCAVIKHRREREWNYVAKQIRAEYGLDT